MRIHRKELINELKESSSIKDAYLRSIDFENNNFLVPFCNVFFNDQRIKNLISKCSDDEITYLHIRSRSSKDISLRSSQEILLEDSNEISFLVLSATGEIHGYICLSNVDNEDCSLEIDNILIMH